MPVKWVFHNEINDFKVKNCIDSGCELKIGNKIKDIIIINIENYYKSSLKKGNMEDNICDFIILCSNNEILKMVITEHKNKNITATKLKKKYLNSYKTIKKIYCSPDVDIKNIKFILLSKGMSHIEAVILRSITLKIEPNIEKQIKHAHCGDYLENLI